MHLCTFLLDFGKILTQNFLVICSTIRVLSHLRITAIYGSPKKWPQNCHRLQFCPHFYLWIKTANGCSSMASQQNCKRWQFCGQFSEFMAYVSTKLQTLAVLWPLFGVYIKVAIKLLTMAVLWSHHSKLSFHHKTANPGSFMATFRSL